jgi:hypothetical protein
MAFKPHVMSLVPVVFGILFASAPGAAAPTPAPPTEPVPGSAPCFAQGGVSRFLGSYASPDGAMQYAAARIPKTRDLRGSVVVDGKTRGFNLTERLDTYVLQLEDGSGGFDTFVAGTCGSVHTVLGLGSAVGINFASYHNVDIDHVEAKQIILLLTPDTNALVGVWLGSDYTDDYTVPNSSVRPARFFALNALPSGG